MLKKLRLKFVLTNMTIVTVMLMVILGMLYHFTKIDLSNQSADAMRILTQSIQQPGGGDKELRNVQLPWFTIRMSFYGEVTVSGSTHYDLTDEAFLRQLIEAVYAAHEPAGFLEEYRLMFNRMPGLGVQYLIFVDTSVQEAALRSQVQMSLLVGVCSVLVFCGISILLARWAIKPVQRAWEQQKQFVSDASHELKTPLAVIMSNAELLQSPDCEEQGKCVGNILTMTYQMRKLVEGLLELSRAENGQVRKSFTRLSLSKLVANGLLPFEPVFFEKALILESSIEDGIFLTGSDQHLGQLVDILVDNAGKYSAPGIVMVQLQRQGRSQCLLTVSNPGEPIPREELERIFDRFYRRDSARSSSGSFGLGLAIAKAIALEHGGKIWAESNPTGNRFCVILPCEAQ